MILKSSYLLIVWLIALIAWFIMTAIFLYHWRRYSLPQDRAIARARIIYLTLTVALIVASAGSLFFF